MARRKKRVTISDVAEMAEVSTMTVSRVINNRESIKPETRQRVQDAIKELGFRPNHIARSLTSDRTLTIGVVIVDIANPFFAEITAGVETASWEKGYNVILCNTQEDLTREREVLRMLEAKQVDGVIVCSARLADEEFIALLEAFPAAIVFNRQIQSNIINSIILEDADGTKRLVNHLIASGHKNLGMVAGSKQSRSAQARIEGFLSAVPNDNPPIERAETAHIQPGYEVAKRLLTQHPDLDGLVCHNDLAAAGAIEACKDMGKRVPQDVAVVGCDDIPLASLTSPKLTTLRVDRRQLGQMITTELFELIEGSQTHTQLTIKHELIVRESAP